MAWLLTVPNLLACATKGAKRADEDGNEALVTIVFAAAAFEGYLNEAAQYVRTRLSQEPHDSYPQIIAFASILPKLEEAHAQLDLKLAVLDAVVGGDTWSSSRQPMQDLMLLVRLRNAVLHPRPLTFYQAGDVVPERPDRIVAALAARGIIESPLKLPVIPTPAPTPSEAHAPWMVAVQTAEVATWALHTVAICMVAFAQTFPEAAPIRAHLEHFLRSVYGLQWEDGDHDDEKSA